MKIWAFFDIYDVELFTSFHQWQSFHHALLLDGNARHRLGNGESHELFFCGNVVDDAHHLVNLQSVITLLVRYTLIDTQRKVGNGGIDMLHECGKLLLVRLPLLLFEEEIYLDGQTCGRGLHLTHHIE